MLPGYLFGVAGVIDTLLDAYLLTREPIHLARLERRLEGLRALYLFEPRAGTSLLPQGPGSVTSHTFVCYLIAPLRPS